MFVAVAPSNQVLNCGVVAVEGMDCPVRVYQLARVEKGHHGRQQGRSGSVGVACQNLVAVLVGPEAQGQPTTRRQAVVAETCASQFRPMRA